MSKKYWLKLYTHFYKDSHIIYLKTQKNGYEYIYLWQCLLLKSLEVDEDKQIGFLRMNDKIPYSPDLLSEIFGINIDIVKSAINIFVNLGMLEILQDGTLYIEAVQKMIGKESESAERVRLHRKRKMEIELNQKLLQCNDDVTKCNPIQRKEEEKEKEKEIEKEEEKEKEKKKIPPSLNDIKNYVIEKNLDVDPIKFFEYFEAGNWIDSKGNKVKNWKQKLLTWSNHPNNFQKKINKSIYKPMPFLED